MMFTSMILVNMGLRRREDCKFKASLGQIVRPISKQEKGEENWAFSFPKGLHLYSLALEGFVTTLRRPQSHQGDSFLLSSPHPLPCMNADKCSMLDLGRSPIHSLSF